MPLFEEGLMMVRHSALIGLIRMKLMLQCGNYTKPLKSCFGGGRTPRLGEKGLSGFIFTVILILNRKMVIL